MGTSTVASFDGSVTFRVSTADAKVAVLVSDGG
jgi:hypothetical protein